MNAETNPRGVLTSEFWLTILGVLALVVLTLHDDVDGEWAAVAIAGACFGYQASRALVKRAQVGGEAQVASLKADLVTLANTPEPAPTVVQVIPAPIPEPTRPDPGMTEKASTPAPPPRPRARTKR